jgi:hypothetical protein
VAGSLAASTVAAAKPVVAFRPTRLSLFAQVAFVLVVTGAAYHYSLATLGRGLDEFMPVANAILAGSLAVLVAAIRGWGSGIEPNIHDRSLDYLVGAALLIAALGIVLILPVTFSVFFWLWRVDLVSLPLFVAGAVCIVLDVRALWRLRVAIALMFLVWPTPYLSIAPGASRLISSAGGAAIVGGMPALFSRSMAALLTLLVIAIAALLLRGPALARIAWVATGLLLALALYITQMVLDSLILVRLIPRYSNWLQGSAGPVSLCIALLVMVAVLPTYALRPRTLRGVSRNHERRSLGSAALATLVVTAAGLLLGVGDAQLQEYESLASPLGTTRLPAASMAGFKMPGWRATQSDSNRWAAVSLDRTASWTRYTYEPIDPTGASPTVPTGSFTVDVISTSNLRLFSTFGVEASYRLQNHHILAADWVELGDGVIGHAVRYALDTPGSNWTGIYWQWPVRTANGLRYQRVVVSARESLAANAAPSVTPGEPLNRIQLALANVSSYLEERANDWRSPPQRDFMLGVARAIVALAVVQAHDGAPASASP